MSADTSTFIAITLDGKPRELPDGTTLAALLGTLGHTPQSVATAVNGSFIPRPQREALTLCAGDAVLVFQPIVGG